MEEERRLAYVAITRAKEGLQLSYVKERSYFGRKITCLPSSFLEEAKLLQQNKPPKQNHPKNTPIKVGDLIRHKIFGTGRVLGVEKGLSGWCFKINCGGNVYDKISEKFVEKVGSGF